MKRSWASLPLAFSTLLVACSAAGRSPGASPGFGDGPVDHPSGDDPVLVIENRGGFVPAEFVATQLPTFVLLGDGRVIMQGAQILIFPGPALPALQVRTLTEEGIQAILAEVVGTNLFGQDLELRGAANFVADASDTVFSLHAGGRDVTVSVYALGFVDPAAGPVPDGISRAELQAHQVLNALNNRLTQLETWLPADAWTDTGWQPFAPDAFRLYVRNATADPQEPGLPQQVRAWPMEGDPAAFGEEEPFFGDGTRCGVVEGEEAATWLVELGAANQLTRWSVDGATLYAVSPRPLLPYEERSCPPLGGGA